MVIRRCDICPEADAELPGTGTADARGLFCGGDGDERTTTSLLDRFLLRPELLTNAMASAILFRKSTTQGL